VAFGLSVTSLGSCDLLKSAGCVVAVPDAANEVGCHGNAFASPDISPRIIALAVNNIHKFMVRRMLVAFLNCT